MNGYRLLLCVVSLLVALPLAARAGAPSDPASSFVSVSNQAAPQQADAVRAPAVSFPLNSLQLVNEDAEKQTWNLQADTLTSLGDGAIIEASGKVFVQKGTEYLKADFARYYPSTNWVYLRGNVEVLMGKDTIHAQEAELDLRSRTGWLKDGNIFMEGPHMYFAGGRVIKHRGDRYTFSQAKVTACDGEVPAWSLTAEQAVVEIDGYAQLYSSAFQVADTSVLASPFMIVPAKTSRQTGLLPPDYGISSKRGMFYTQPYFVALDESHDMTLFATMMEKVGFMGSAQYRAQTTTLDKSWLMASGLSSKHIITSPSDDPTDNHLSRTNWNRYWLRGMSDGHVGVSPWRYKLDLDYVSDQNFLREFGTGPVGFDASRRESFRMFGRDLREDDQKRLSAGIIYRDWERAGVAMSMRYEQDATLNHGNRPSRQDETVQQLPRIDAFLYKGRIVPSLPLEVEMQANTAYMYRREGTKGGRTEIYPRVSLPWDLKYASIIGTVGWRQTMYNTSVIDSTDPLQPFKPTGKTPHQTGTYRSIPDMDIQMFTDANRIWKLTPETPLVANKESVGRSEWTGLRHEIQPRVRYTRTPSVDQEENPFYTLDDRMLPTNELTYSVTNIITRKASTVTQTGDGKDEEPTFATTDDYLDLLWWRLESGYDYEEDARDQHTETYARRPVKDILSELILSPLHWFSYSGKTFISPYDGDVSRHDHSINLYAKPWLSWSTGLSFRTADYELRRRLQYEQRGDVIPESPLRLLHNAVSLDFNKTWGVRLSEYRNLRTSEVYDRNADITYTAQCYRIIGRMSADGNERSYSVFVELPGLFED